MKRNKQTASRGSVIARVGIVVVLISTLVHAAVGIWEYRATRRVLEEGMAAFQPVAIQNGTISGKTSTRSPDTLVQQVIQKNKLLMIWRVVGLGLLTGLLLWIFIRKWVAGPLVQLREKVIRLQDETSGEPIAWDADGTVQEIRRLAEAVAGLVAKISAHQQAEMASIERQGRLEARIRENLTEFESLKTALDTAKSVRNEFLARMSHEIRTPINAIAGITNIVLKTELDTEQEDYLNCIQIASNNLKAVVSDILDFTMIQCGQMVLTRSTIDLDQLLEALSVRFKPLAEKKGLALVVSKGAQVPNRFKGDSVRLMQALAHLVRNGIKFTTRGEVSVEVTRAVTVGDAPVQPMLDVHVRDTGIGISPELLSTIFEPFSQADNSLTRDTDGAGMGLALCKHLVELMGGKLSVQSMLEMGSTFLLTVPLDTPEPAVLEPGGGKDLSGYTVLMVEDSEFNRVVTAALLSEKGIATMIAENGRKAVEMVTHAPMGFYDAVLMDIQMPVMDGFEATRRIRKWESRQHHAPAPDESEGGPGPPKSIPKLPIIALTAHAIKGEKESCMISGMDAYISKPIDEIELFQTLFKLMAPAKPPRPSDAPLNDFSAPASPLQAGNTGWFDAGSALMRIGGRRHLLLKMISNFKSEFGSAHQEIRRLLASDDRDAVRRISHKVKGAAGQLSAIELSQAAASLEDQVMNASQDMAPLLIKFKDVLHHSLEAMSAFLEENSTLTEAGAIRSPPKADENVMLNLKSLAGYLKSGDMRAVETWALLRARWTTAGVNPLVEKLDEKMNKLDFEGASTLLIPLMDQYVQGNNAHEG